MTQNTQNCPLAKIEDFIKQLHVINNDSKALKETLTKLQKELLFLKSRETKQESSKWIVK